MYGDRDEPYTVLARLGQRLEATLDPDAVLPTVVETVATALKLPYAAICSVERGLQPGTRAGAPSVLAEYGEGAALPVPAGATPSAARHTPWVAVPLLYQGTDVGQLLLAPRAGETHFNADDQRVIDDLARQVGAAVHAVRLTADLRRSRERVITTREEERLRLRRDLHDGLGPTLAGVAQRIGLAAALVPQNPQRSVLLLHQLEDHIRATITDVRRLVYDLRPPVLDQYGLLGAIRAEAPLIAGSAVTVSIEAPERMPSLPAAVEVAAYRIVMEALTNVVRHAAATHCVIQISLRDSAPGREQTSTTLTVAICDDGCGVALSATPGIGLRSMRERAEELGGTCVVEARPDGGTCIQAGLPLTDREPGTV
jgi:signal transduction histidine kinase